MREHILVGEHILVKEYILVRNHVLVRKHNAVREHIQSPLDSDRRTPIAHSKVRRPQGSGSAWPPGTNSQTSKAP